MESIGFKEWALVCEALGRGEQSVILRKGGIAEGRAGFEFEHREFFLFPTFFHEQLARVRMPEAAIPAQAAGEIELRYFARAEAVGFLTEWDAVAALEPLHVLREEVVRERFEYEGARGIHVAFVRVFRVEPAWRFPYERRFGGCRSWVNLPEAPPGLQREPVLDEQSYGDRLAMFTDTTRLTATAT